MNPDGGWYYCFNEDCNRWGERATGFGIHLIWPQPGYFPGGCKACGHGLYFHDSWDGDNRLGDDGKPVAHG